MISYTQLNFDQVCKCLYALRRGILIVFEALLCVPKRNVAIVACLACSFLEGTPSITSHIILTDVTLFVCKYVNNHVLFFTENIALNSGASLDPIGEEHMSPKEKYENAVRKSCLYANIVKNDVAELTGLETFG